MKLVILVTTYIPPDGQLRLEAVERAVGSWTEGVSAMAVDQIYNKHICSSEGPTVELALLRPWSLLFSVELGNLKPGQPVPEDRLQGEVIAETGPLPPRRLQ